MCKKWAYFEFKGCFYPKIPGMLLSCKLIASMCIGRLPCAGTWSVFECCMCTHVLSRCIKDELPQWRRLLSSLEFGCSVQESSFQGGMNQRRIDLSKLGRELKNMCHKMSLKELEVVNPKSWKLRRGLGHKRRILCSSVLWLESRMLRTELEIRVPAIVSYLGGSNYWRIKTLDDFSSEGRY